MAAAAQAGRAEARPGRAGQGRADASAPPPPPPLPPLPRYYNNQRAAHPPRARTAQAPAARRSAQCPGGCLVLARVLACALAGPVRAALPLPILPTHTPLSTVNGLQARTFGIWTLLSSVIRCLCAIDIRNTTLYYITLFTFFMALVHFLSEVFIYHTAALTIGVMAPLMVASFSILGMLIGLQYLEVEAVSENKKKN
ncbi:probable ergosterol biosynthetic protein 28 [Nothoprocta perdicaria]|uniref:probable ergosterol biosynthetic protein 28 n=1 Tax=Nothoprocta perdicaria TaxID=30464 RepID=UPI000E1BC195|nr:probable ergosterol biosynthetic protein 28 [Nothoprocta perdicaria]